MSGLVGLFVLVLFLLSLRLAVQAAVGCSLCLLSTSSLLFIYICTYVIVCVSSRLFFSYPLVLLVLVSFLIVCRFLSCLFGYALRASLLTLALGGRARRVALLEPHVDTREVSSSPLGQHRMMLPLSAELHEPAWSCVQFVAFFLH